MEAVKGKDRQLVVAAECVHLETAVQSDVVLGVVDLAGIVEVLLVQVRIVVLHSRRMAEVVGFGMMRLTKEQ